MTERPTHADDPALAVSDNELALAEHAATLLASPLESTDFGKLGSRTEGKVRDSYLAAGGAKLFLVTTDRASAFDFIWGTVPLKGQLLNLCAAWWFDKTSDIVANHLLDVPDPNLTVARACKPLPVEFVVRGYLTGTTSTSIWTHYANGARSFCGHALPDGLKKHQQLPEALVTPSTKAEQGGHDRSVSRQELIDEGVITASDFDEAAEAALAVFARGQKLASERGLMLVDTKYEFGRDAKGKLRLIDEVHTPDSSRYWHAGSYVAALAKGEDPEALDKDYLRRWLRGQGWQLEGPKEGRPLPAELRLEAARRYLRACEMLCGPLPLSFEPPLPRLQRVVGTISG